jgi:hypothetical protein
MADAEDLKSSGDFSSCGFDSHPGHHVFLPSSLSVSQAEPPALTRLWTHKPQPRRGNYDVSRLFGVMLVIDKARTIL